MNFCTVPFLVFFALVTVLTFVLPHRLRWAFLLSASWYFYAYWRPEYLVLLIFSTVVDYGVALWLERIKDPGRRRALLLVSMTGNLGLLIVFKYFDFVAGAVSDLARMVGFTLNLPALEVTLPPGISFYTFQTMSYVIDVYRGEMAAQKHLGKFALFVSFFPHLVAGPILRAPLLLPQFDRVQRFDADRIVSGLKRMAWGFFKKIVIADRLAFYVTHVYNSPGSYDGLHALVATYFFAFQIYCDFSGYSDIAIGAARVLGIDLMENFRQPYFATSLRDFWARWHISLSTWFRDYLYIPLGGNRRGEVRTCLNLLITMYLAGLWHGASWTFIVWGIYHGTLLVLARRLPEPPAPSPMVNAARILITFHLVCLGWVLFRSITFRNAGVTLIKIFSIPFTGDLRLDQIAHPIGARNFVLDLLLIVLLLAVDRIERRELFPDWLDRRSFLVRALVYLGLLYGVILLGPGGNIPFIYFQF